MKWWWGESSGDVVGGNVLEDVPDQKKRNQGKIRRVRWVRRKNKEMEKKNRKGGGIKKGEREKKK